MYFVFVMCVFRARSDMYKCILCYIMHSSVMLWCVCWEDQMTHTNAFHFGLVCCDVYIQRTKSYVKSTIYCISHSSFPLRAISLGLTIFGKIFVYMIIFDPTIAVVTFCLYGWGMLGVFFFLAFTQRDMNVRSFEPVRWNACVHRLDLGLYSHPKVLGNGVRTHVNSKGKVPSTRRSEEARTYATASHTTASPTHYQLSYSSPAFHIHLWCCHDVCVQSEDQGPLEGVVIAVSKKLSVNQMEYNTMVVELGGDYSWHYSSTCTHFIFQVSGGTCHSLRGGDQGRYRCVILGGGRSQVQGKLVQVFILWISGSDMSGTGVSLWCVRFWEGKYVWLCESVVPAPVGWALNTSN